MPSAPSNIYFKDNTLNIFLGDMNSYVIVDGIRCYYNLIYELETDTVHTHIKDYKIDGLVYSDAFPVSFPVTAMSFPVSRRDLREVVPQRDYTEVTSAYLSDRTELDERIIKFLKNNPDMFEQVDISIWEKLSNAIALSDFDEDLLEDYLPKHVEVLFRDEVLG